MNHEKYLYLLPFKNNKYFKIGISSNNNSRILQLNKIYDIDLDSSLIVTSKNSDYIKVLERELLCLFPKVNDKNLNKYEGHTEIREIKYYNKVIEIIKNKDLIYNIKIENFKKKNITNIKNRIKIIENNKKYREYYKKKVLIYLLKQIKANNFKFKECYKIHHSSIIKDNRNGNYQRFKEIFEIICRLKYNDHYLIQELDNQIVSKYEKGYIFIIINPTFKEYFQDFKEKNSIKELLAIYKNFKEVDYEKEKDKFYLLANDNGIRDYIIAEFKSEEDLNTVFKNNILKIPKHKPNFKGFNHFLKSMKIKRRYQFYSYLDNRMYINKFNLRENFELAGIPFRFTTNHGSFFSMNKVVSQIIRMNYCSKEGLNLLEKIISSKIKNKTE